MQSQLWHLSRVDQGRMKWTCYIPCLNCLHSSGGKGSWLKRVNNPANSGRCINFAAQHGVGAIWRNVLQ